jgi:uncharacterized membrane protein (DUF373 family)
MWVAAGMDSRAAVPENRDLLDRGMVVAERAVYGAIALLLLAGALIALGAIAWELATNLDDGALKQVEAALSGLLLVFILIELLGAVRATIIEQKLVAEPFLVVGIIAAIKGILVGSLEAGTKSGDALEDAMVEVVGLGLLVLFLALAAFLVRRKEREPTERDG